MRVGIDYLPAVLHAPGLGRYARELVRALVRLPDAPELRLFEVGRGPRRFAGAALGLAGARVPRVRRLALPLPQRAVSALHALTGLGAERWLGGVDLFHRVRVGAPPLSRRARVLLPVPELPRAGSPADGELARELARAGNALVFCAAYRERVRARYDLDPARVFQAPVGCDHWLRDLPAAVPRAAPACVLVLGALREERRPLQALEAFELLRAGGVEAELVFVGGSGSAAEAFERRRASSPAAPWVRWRADLAEAEMPGLVAASSALLHLAEDEGTAVTPLEAFALGVPVVATRLPAFEEALAGHARLVDLDAPPAALAEALATSLAGAPQEPGARARRDVAAASTWEANARRTVAVWRTILGLDDGETGPARA